MSEKIQIFLNIFKKIGKSFQKIFKIFYLVKLLKPSKQFISNFTERLEILRNLQNTDMK